MENNLVPQIHELYNVIRFYEKCEQNEADPDSYNKGCDCGCYVGIAKAIAALTGSTQSAVFRDYRKFINLVPSQIPPKQ
jgi:hypothetical protein